MDSYIRNGQILADKMYDICSLVSAVFWNMYFYIYRKAMKGTKKHQRFGATPIPNQSNNEKPKSRTKKDRTRGKWRRYVARKANRNRLKAAKSKKPYVSVDSSPKEMDAEPAPAPPAPPSPPSAPPPPPPPAEVEPQGVDLRTSVDSAQSPNDSFSDASAIEFRDAHTKIAKELADTTRRIPEPAFGFCRSARCPELNIRWHWRCSGHSYVPFERWYFALKCQVIGFWCRTRTSTTTRSWRPTSRKSWIRQR